MKEGCGIFAIYGHKRAAELTYLGLYALQHRGDEGSGIVSGDGERMYVHKGLGLVSDVFKDHSIFDRLKGTLAIGHNRYSTTGSSVAINTQPLLVKCKDVQLAIAHNGNLTNTVSVRRELEDAGALFQTTMDSEIIVHLVAKSKKQTIVEGIIDALSCVRGAYCLLFATRDKIIAVRDPYGFRPLCLGRLDDAWVVASESCALDMVGAKYIRDVEPGELIVIDQNGVDSVQALNSERLALCIFEYIYFSRPDSRIFGDYVDKARRRLGRQLAQEHPAEADIVISVPDSSNTAALGYSEQSGIRFEIGLIRNHYVGRTFINPSQSIREFNTRIKYNPVGGVLKNKRIVVVEDSIVRGTTMKHLAKMMRRAGAKEIHVRVSCPPIKSPCFYGIDFQTHKELTASSMSVEGIRELLGVESLKYLSVEGMLKSVPNPPQHYCTACFTRDYPVQIDDNIGKLELER